MNKNVTRRMLKENSVKIPIFTNLPQHNQKPKTKVESKLLQPIDANISCQVDDENIKFFDETEEQSSLSEHLNIEPEIVQIQGDDGEIYDAILSTVQPKTIGGEFNYETTEDINTKLPAQKTPIKYISNEHFTAVVQMLQKSLHNQSQLLSNILDLKNNLIKLNTEFENFKRKLTFEKECLHVQESVLVPELWKFNKIDTEQSLIEFENKIVADTAFKNECIIKIKKTIGSMVGTTCYECALKLNRVIFTNDFWASTAWTGGRAQAKKRTADNEGGALDEAAETDETTVAPLELYESSNNTKFVFSSHRNFIEFFKQLVLYVNGSLITDEDLKKFVQGRSRNAFYQPKTNRLPGERVKQRKIT